MSDLNKLIESFDPLLVALYDRIKECGADPGKIRFADIFMVRQASVMLIIASKGDRVYVTTAKPYILLDLLFEK